MGGVNVTVETVGRQCGQVVLLGLPLIIVVSLVSGDDDQRLTVEVGQGRACCIAAFASTNSSMKLPRWRAVDELARASSREHGGRLP